FSRRDSTSSIRLVRSARHCWALCTPSPGASTPGRQARPNTRTEAAVRRTDIDTLRTTDCAPRNVSPSGLALAQAARRHPVAGLHVERRLPGGASFFALPVLVQGVPEEHLDARVFR